MTATDDHKGASDAHHESRDPATEPPPTTSKPLGDALPGAPEPGLDQPLPPKAPSKDGGSGRP